MMNEQRALATLDLTLKNAFETLNKFYEWSVTSKSDVTFNFVDALPTLNSNGTGIFLKPITVPSFSSVQSTIFGVKGQSSLREMYYDINFRSNGAGWTFQPYSSGDSPTLKIYSNTLFGNGSSRITVKTNNVDVTVANTAISLDSSSSITVSGTKAGNKALSVNSSTFKTLSDTILIGNTASKIRAYGNLINLAGAFVFDSTHTAVGKTTLPTKIYGSDVAIIAKPSHNLEIGYSTTNGVKALVSSYASGDAYGIYLATLSGDAIDFLQVGEDNFNVKSMNFFAKNFSLSAGNAGLQITEDTATLNSVSKTRVTSDTLTEIGSTNTIKIGVVDSAGDISSEVVVTKGSVVIPNLYQSKKLNYTLSGIKHRSVTQPSNSLEYFPGKTGITGIPKGYSNAIEYSVNLADALTVDLDELSAYDTTINSHSGDRKSYIVHYINNKVTAYVADVDSDDNLLSTYSDQVTFNGISLDGSEDARPVVFSTDSYMYICTITDEAFNIFYSSDSLNFSPLTTISKRDRTGWSGGDNFTTRTDLSIAAIGDANTLTDSIWIAITYGSYTDIINVINTCGVPKTHRNANGYHQGNPTIIVDDSFGSGSQANGAAKIKCYKADDGSIYAILAFTVFYSTTTYRSDTGVNFAIAKFEPTIGDDGELLIKLVDGTNEYSGGEYYQTSKTVKAAYILGAGVDDEYVAGKIIDFTYNPTNGGFVGYVDAPFFDKTSVKNENTIIYSSTAATASKRIKHSTKLTASKSINDDRTLSVLISSTDAYVESNNAYNLLTATTSTLSGYNRVLAANSFAKNTKLSISYTIGTDIHSIAISHVEPNLKKNFSMYGSFVDYLNISGQEYYISDNRFLLTNSILGENRYVLDGESSPTATNVEYGTVSDSSGELQLIVDMSNSLFSERDSIVSKLNGNAPVEVFVGNGYIIGHTFDIASGEVTRIPTDSASAGSPYTSIVANIHFEPISYIAKNRLAVTTGIEIGGYHILPTNSSGVYELTFDNNGRSGYKIPFYSALRKEQLYQSVYTVQGPNEAKKASLYPLDFQYREGTKMYIIPSNTYTFAIFVNAASDFNYDNGIFVLKNAYTVIKFETKYLDPTDSSFNPKTAIVNESNNVVSIRCDYINGYRAGMIRPETAVLVTGLTEVGSVGGNC